MNYCLNSGIILVNVERWLLMKNLFIIGNGFDMAHGIKSSYSEFREFLINRCEKIENKYDLEKVGRNNFGDADKEIINTDSIEDCEDDSKDYIYMRIILYYMDFCHLGNHNWSELENKMGDDNSLKSIIEDITDVILPDDEEDYAFQDSCNVQNLLVKYTEALMKIPDYFSEWIETVVSPSVVSKKISAINKFEKLILSSNDNLFLNFNYTDTLGAIYGVSEEDVIHIHGCTKYGTKIVVGHAVEETQSSYFGTGSKESFVEAELTVWGTETFENLRKDTDSIINNNLDFFDKIKDVDKVYSYGFSYGEADINYLKKIIDSIRDTSNTSWFIENHPGPKVIASMENSIKSLGYNGKFYTF